MSLNCPDCRFPIPSEDVNIVKTIAKCKSCNNIFDFNQDIGGEELPGRYRKEIVIPPGIEVLHLMNELEIMINWRKSAKHFSFVFTIIWNVFIFIFTSVMVASGATEILLFMIPFILVGAYLIYLSVGHFVNTTYITVDDKRLSIDHRPIKFLSQKDQNYSPDEIEQLYVRKYSPGSQNDQPVWAYAVDMILKNGKRITLAKELHAVSYARYIEQEIEYFLKIKDRPVKGEYEEGLNED